MLTVSTFVFGQGQTYLSESWTGQGGQMAVFYHNVTKTDAYKNVYVAGSTLNAANNNDIILQKFNGNGMLLWQKTFNGAANLDDMAADIFIDNQFNVYVTGTSIANASSDFDLVVLKYKSNGQLIWSKYYNNSGGQPIPKDAGTSITGDNNGSIFVTGGSFGHNTLADYVTLRLNTLNGNIQWVQRYDYDQFNDLASTIRLSGNNVVVSGGSQVSISPNRYEMATLVYNISSGAQMAVKRSSGNATSGTDEIFDVTTDNNGNFYLTGSEVNTSTGTDIAIYKLNSNLDILWQQSFDGHGNTDKGYGIKLDSQGNVYVAGYTETNDEGDNYAILKYNNSGSLIWSREFNGQANLDDRAAQLVIDENDRIYVTGEARNASNSDYQTVGYTPSGDIFTQVSYDNPEGQDDKASDIAIDLDGNLIVVGQTFAQGSWRNFTVKYSVMERTNIPSGGADNHINNEIIVKFSPDLVDTNFVDNKAELFRQLSGVIPDSIALKMKLKTGINFDDKRTVEAIKIYPSMTRSDSISISRQGTEVHIPKFWSSFLLTIPSSSDLGSICDSLNTMYPQIYYAELNYIYSLDDVPDDDDYTAQHSLQQNNLGINAENAWNFEKGNSTIKVGIYDTGIDYEHPDFSWDGSNTFEGSVIKGGKAYATPGMPLIQNISNPAFNSHGTKAASIVGAIRNNGDVDNSFIAGIAGGDYNNDQKGVSLYAMKINPGGSIFMDPSSIPNAIFEGASSTAYGLNIMNSSYGSSEINEEVKNMVEFAWRNGVTFVASRGNHNLGEPTSIETQAHYPACYDDKWVLNIGASGTDALTPGVGSRKVSGNGNLSDDFDNGRSSAYGQGMDLIAPGTTALVRALESGNYTESDDFGGTSAAAPHAAGTAALLMSKQNSTLAGSPANLAPEDIEFLMQKYATPITEDFVGGGGLPIPNMYAGYGRVNAENTLAHLDYPMYRVEHPNPTLTIDLTNYSQVYIYGNNTGLATGYYNATRKDYTFIYQLQLPTSQTIIDWWPRWSATFGVSPSNMVDGTSDAQFNVISQSAHSIEIHVTTTAWHITSNVYNLELDVYVPVPFSEIRSGISVHILDNLVTSAENIISKKNLRIYPNPVSQYLNVSCKQTDGEDITYTILDIYGKKVLEGNTPSSSLPGFQIPVQNLSSGLYMFSITIDNSIFTEKFVKQ